MLMVFCTDALAVWFGGIMILEKGYKGGDVMNVIVAVLIRSVSPGKATPCIRAFAPRQAAAYKMFETIKRKPEIDAYDTKQRVLQNIHGNIELRDVDFNYPSRPDERILHGFCLSIPSGATAALVGQRPKLDEYVSCSTKWDCFNHVSDDRIIKRSTVESGTMMSFFTRASLEELQNSRFR